jgi:hypothetical protein
MFWYVGGILWTLGTPGIDVTGRMYDGLGARARNRIVAVAIDARF